ncbi:LysR family transcriptional regulator [Rhodoferax sp.]|uniref:LysR family transcriptional regulator n=1 Tax=Rhodoferax sp. TaxID=50421 RepID=UPI002847CDCB|nr:LysR family transcriptional regulator [Rhodoferax sp.]MDR3371070.1 LysR family transcriptional regulator [Rhodoferax sp.]
MSFVDHMLVFSRVAELSSFTQAADSLGLPKASVSMAVQQLENRLGARLLHRTTRKVVLTHDGQTFYERCKDVLADMDELQTMFQLQSANALKGRVRLDMSTVIARHAVLPRLPDLLNQHPQLQIEISSTERRVDLVREGFDCVVRAGTVTEPGLIARPVGDLRMVNCVSPGYIARFGVPHSLVDLATHTLVHYAATLGAKPTGFEYTLDGNEMALPMPGAVTVNNAEAYQAACLAGLGVIQAPFVGIRELIAQGQLVEVMTRWPAPPMPLSLVYAHRRNLSTRVRVVMDWLHGVLVDYLKPSPDAPLPGQA